MSRTHRRYDSDTYLWKTQLTKHYLLCFVKTPVPVRTSKKQHSLQDSAAPHIPDGDLGHLHLLHHLPHDHPGLVQDKIVSGGVILLPWPPIILFLWFNFDSFYLFRHWWSDFVITKYLLINPEAQDFYLLHDPPTTPCSYIYIYLRCTVHCTL